MIRRARPSDLGAIELVRRDAAETNGGPAQVEDCLVHEAGGRVDAFLLYRRVVEETEILNLAVSPDARRQGVATALIRQLVESSAGDVLLEVRSANVSARTLYGALGFAEEGVRKGYYREPADDAILLRLHA